MAYAVKNLSTVQSQSQTEFTAFATWQWDSRVKYLSEYKVIWQYHTGDGVWFIGNESTTKYTQSTYSVPSNATYVRVRVLPIAETVKDNKKNVEKARWYGKWTTSKPWHVPAKSEDFPTPSVPRVEIQSYQNRWRLTAVLDNTSAGPGITRVQFEVVEDNKIRAFKTATVRIGSEHAQYQCDVAAGHEYKVRARFQIGTTGIDALKDANAPWSDYSDGLTAPEMAPPETPAVSASGQTLVMSVSIYNDRAPTKIRFQVVKNNKDIVKIGDKNYVDVTINKNYAEYKLNVEYDNRYKVRALCWKDKGEIGDISDWSEYSDNVEITQEDLTIPPVPSVDVKGLRLTASTSVYDNMVSHVDFELIRGNARVSSKASPYWSAKLSRYYAAYSWDLQPGYEYKVRARSRNGTSRYSGWSQYSSLVSTAPAKIEKLDDPKATSDTSVTLTWTKATSAESYEIQYADNANYFDKSPDNVKSMTVEGVTTAIITGLDTGKIWYFRVRATNSQGSSLWTTVKKVRIGTKPAAPTTWSYTSTVSIGQDAVLNWVHNSEDGSDQTSAQVRLTINGTANTFNVSGKTSVYRIKTGAYKDGTIIYWEVRTKGAMTADSYFSPWSTKRQITIYAPVSVNVSMYTDSNWHWDTFEFAVDTIYSAKGDGYNPITDGVVTHLPLYLSAEAYPKTQTAVSFSVAIVANETYDTLDDFGQATHIQKGMEVYKQTFTSIKKNKLSLMLSAGDVNLESDMSYTIVVEVAMNSGLSGEATQEFEISWIADTIEPNAEVAIDFDTMTAHIRPFCDGGYADALLSVYRREYDGTFTPIAVNIDGEDGTTVTDPHPSLDYARYRIVALSKVNGLVNFADIPGIEVGCSSIIIQWDEEWTPFDIDDLGLLAEAPYSGSMLILPYNIDVQNNVNRDVSLVNYIGRSNPVSYYGTQRGETASWSSDIPAYDVETLYQIRRLAQYAGDVYVREPSGIGYWANVTVSYKLEHTKTVVPITLDIKRVDGGM